MDLADLIHRGKNKDYSQLEIIGTGACTDVYSLGESNYPYVLKVFKDNGDYDDIYDYLMDIPIVPKRYYKCNTFTVYERIYGGSLGNVKHLSRCIVKEFLTHYIKLAKCGVTISDLHKSNFMLTSDNRLLVIDLDKILKIKLVDIISDEFRLSEDLRITLIPLVDFDLDALANEVYREL